MRSTVFLCAALLALASGSAFSAEDCREKAETQAALNLCADKDFEKAENDLAVLVPQLAAKITPAGGAKLRAALDVWRNWRDAQCEFETFGRADSSAHPMVLADCYERLTSEYVETLRLQLNCEEGDISCGGQ